jgi:hypothetical protein
MLERKIENMSLNLTSVDQNEQEIMKIKPIRCESGGMDRMEGINGMNLNAMKMIGMIIWGGGGGGKSKINTNWPPGDKHQRHFPAQV